MEKIISFVKEHPMLTGATALFVLLVIFWPRGGGGSDGGTTDAAIIASAVGASQKAASDLALSHDQLQAVGMQTAAAVSMNESNNAAAASIASYEASTALGMAGLQAQTDQAAIAAELHAATLEANTGALATIAKILPTTQRQANAAGQTTDAAGFALTQLFQNLLNFEQGKTANITAVVQAPISTSAPAPTSSGEIRTRVRREDDHRTDPPFDPAFVTYNSDGKVTSIADVTLNTSRGTLLSLWDTLTGAFTIKATGK